MTSPAPNGEWVPLAALALATLVFAVIAPRFLTVANFFEVTRFSVEIGLIAIGITPVLITGGIDLSVGSILGLTAVVFGIAHVDWQLSTPIAAGLALLVGVAGGSLNAVLIARLSIPPLIVTLGTLSLFRGIAEGLTQAAVNYSGFPPGCSRWARATWRRRSDATADSRRGGCRLRGVVARFGDRPHLVHDWIRRRRRALCRCPVAQRLALVYVLSGVMASLAGIIYVAHVGQARADAGNGYELDAVTAVVLGGTSVFGGRGTMAV